MLDDPLSPRTPLRHGAWYLWREVAVRGAGFPARQLSGICDVELSAAADGSDGPARTADEQYEKVFAASTERLSAAVREIARDDRFREAVTWQNPKLVPNCLDRAAMGEPRNVRGRNHELTIASYLQRYCLKNDSVGFFGPVGWARIDPGEPSLAATPGPQLLSRRTTYLEYWAVDVLAAKIAARHEVLPWLTPCVSRHGVLTGQVMRLPFGKPVVLTPAELRVLGRCDGHRTVRDLIGDPPDVETLGVLFRLRDLGVLSLDLGYPVTRWPERALAERIERIRDPDVRARVLAPLTELTQARDAVSAAASDAQRVYEATSELTQVFERITGAAATRRAGGTYAGRTVAYEDTVRAVDVRLGRRVMDALTGPLGLLLDSATWLVNTVVERYLAACLRLVDRLTADGSEGVPLLRVLSEVMPEVLVPGAAPPSPTVCTVIEEFQQRWQRVLDVPPDVRRYRVDGEAIVDRVAREFATGVPRWSGGRRHSPDLLISAEDVDAVARGEFELVFGELHLASNTLENRLFVAQHPDSSRLRAAAEADRLDGRVVTIGKRDAYQVTTRLTRSSELMLPSYTYLSVGEESIAVPDGATVLPGVDLLVMRDDDALVVRRGADATEYDFVEVVADPLTMLVADAFQPLRVDGHRPRVSIDQMVVGREAWRFAAADTAWAFVKDERRRYVEARRWRAASGLPERCFFAVPVERKPMAVDFRSLPLVNLLAKSIRRTADVEGGSYTIAEMLPDVGDLWLSDADGERYTSELRFVAVHG